MAPADEARTGASVRAASLDAPASGAVLSSTAPSSTAPPGVPPVDATPPDDEAADPATTGARAIAQRRFRLASVAVAVASIIVFLFLLWTHDDQAALAVSDLTIPVAAALAAVATAWRARRSQGRRRTAWALMSAAMLFDTIAETWWGIEELLLGKEIPFPSPIDVPYFLAYFTVLAALAYFPPRASRSEFVQRILDTVLLVIALLSLSWIVLLEDIVAEGGTFLETAVGIGYPVLDVAVAAVFLLVVSQLPSGHRLGPTLAGTGMMLWVFGDTAYAVIEYQGIFVSGGELDTSWFLGYLLVALGAVHPPGTVPSPPPAHPQALPTPSRLFWLPYAPVLLFVPTVMHEYVVRNTVSPFMFVLGITLILLFSVRQAFWTTGARTANMALARSEERFRDVLTRGSDLTMTVDAGGVVRYVAPAVRRILGYAPHDVEGRNVAYFMHPDDAASGTRGLARFLEGSSDEVLDLRIRHADGHYLDMEALGSSERTPGSEALEFVVSLRDVSERRARERAEEEARLQREELERMESIDRLKSSFINAAAHEISTPLTPIVLELSMLRDGHSGPLSAQQRRSLDSLGRNVTRLQELSKRLIQASQVQGRGVRVRVVEADLVRLVEDAVAPARPAAAERDVRFDVRVVPAPGWRADQAALSVALAQVVENAVRASPDEGVVRVRAGPEAPSDPESAVVLEVEDHGSGLDAEQQERLFQPFVHVHGEAQDASGGAGLGLFLARATVEGHGGTLEVHSDGPGRGSRFTFRVPHDAVQEPGPSGTPGVVGGGRDAAGVGPPGTGPPGTGPSGGGAGGSRGPQRRTPQLPHAHP